MRKRSAKIHSVADARVRARRALPKVLFDFIDGGADEEVTLRDNQDSYAEVKLLSRAAVFPEKPLLEKLVLNTSVAMPVVLAPCGGVRFLHPDGDRAVVRAAGNAGVACVTSAASGTSVEDVAKVATGPLWFQLPFASRPEVEELIDRAQKSGFGALFVTVDSAGWSNLGRIARHRATFPIKKNLRHAVHYLPQLATHPRWTAGFIRDGLPTEFSMLKGNTGASASSHSTNTAKSEKKNEHPCPHWTDIDWIRRQWKGPLVVKGVMNPDDARSARDHGADAVVVSNHGGRQLDGGPASLRVLSSVKSAVGGDLEILIDGGIRRATDVVRALALGADAVMIGRSYLYGVAAAGEAGVSRILEIYRDDLARALRQLGCSTIAEVNASVVDSSALRTVNHFH